ncbi:MAG: DUF2339 domain-containing protein [Acidobacteriota bacterium]
MLLFIAFCLIAFQFYRLTQLSGEIEQVRGARDTGGHRLANLEVLVGALQRTVLELVKAKIEPATSSEKAHPATQTATPTVEVAVEVAAPIPDLPTAPIPMEQFATQLVEEPVTRMEMPTVAAVVDAPAPSAPMTAHIEPPTVKTAGPEKASRPLPAHERNWEEMIGGNLLNKLGALVLVIGIALFLSYSFGRSGPMGRALTGLGVSLSMLAGSIWLERRPNYQLFSRGVIAAGWASLYFTTYAMYALPATQIISNAFVGVCLMIAVAAAMVVHSLRYKVQALTSLAYGCVYAALALSADNTFAVIALIPLAASALYLARRMQWYEMTTFAAAATYATFASRPTSGASLVSIESILLVYWVMFELFDILRIAARQVIDTKHQALYAINAAAGLGASAVVWHNLAPDSMWLYYTLAGSLYLASTAVRFALDRDAHYEFSLAIAAILGALGIFARVPGIWISTTMILEAEILFLGSLYPRLRWARPLSWLAFAAAIVNLTNYPGSTLVWGVEVHQWAPPLGLLAAIFYLNRALSKQEQYFSYAASVAVAILIGSELPWGVAGIGWMAFGAVLFETGLRTNGRDLRLQSYALSLLGMFGAAFNPMDPLPVHNGWVFLLGAVLSIAVALRATLSLKTLPEIEQRVLRFGGSLGTALLGGMLVHHVVQAEYSGIVMLVLSVCMVELALRRLPAEMLLPAAGLHMAGLRFLLDANLRGIEKHPAQHVLIGFGGAALIYYWLAARTMRTKSEVAEPLQLLAPWIGSVFAFVAIWMALPDPFVPVAYAALALLSVELGVRLNAPNLVRMGRVLSLASVGSLFLLDIPNGAPRISNVLLLAGSQWYLWFRTRRSRVAFLHGWVAAILVGVLIPWETNQYPVAFWSLFGVGLTCVAKYFRLRDLRLQAAMLAAVAGFLNVIGTQAIWQSAALVAWYLIAVILEDTAGGGNLLRQGYSIAITIVSGIALFNKISGGMLTLSWTLEAVTLLVAGFAVRERMLRLSGLTVLLICIGKVFFYDLRNLDTVYRILSFIGLGVCLLLVSWIYTRFKDQLQKYL